MVAIKVAEGAHPASPRRIADESGTYAAIEKSVYERT